MKSMKKLVVPVVVLGLTCLAALGTTYAWFTASQNARAEGLELTATVPNNLQISTDEETWDTSVELTSGVTEMIPASSALGAAGTFYYVDFVEGEGGAISAGSTVKASAVVNSQKDGAAYYIDIPVYLRLTSDDAYANIKINSVSINAERAGQDTLADAYRVAIFHVNSEESINKQIFFGGNPFDISTGEKAYAVFPLIGTDGMSEEASVGLNTPFEIYGKTPAELVVRIWLEGQDKNCADKNSTDAVSISIDFGG